MDNHHQDVRRSLQNALSLATNDQRNLEHIKEMFLEIASSFKDSKKVGDEVKFNKNSNSQIRCRFCSRRGHKEKDCFKKIPKPFAMIRNLARYDAATVIQKIPNGDLITIP